MFRADVLRTPEKKNTFFPIRAIRGLSTFFVFGVLSSYQGALGFPGFMRRV